jgi:uncharacterized 2Fe-2S/4Fe-4S cluster protein (DUF4445 family)
MSRVQFALTDGGAQRLRESIRKEMELMIYDCLTQLNGTIHPIKQITIVGNTVMHHLFCGFDVTPLSLFPFETTTNQHKVFQSGDLGWRLSGDPSIIFLPCMGGFVGSDILAGILTTKMHTSERLIALADLGTNGEIVVGNRDRILFASTAAGPAFEGARISMGMRAATGAIASVSASDFGYECTVIGDVQPRGICGSGLVDAIAVFLKSGLINSNGRIQSGRNLLPLFGPVVITQSDIRQLQLAKGAIAAGLRILLEIIGAKPTDISTMFLAGAFGNYIGISSAERIGLFDASIGNIKSAGNTALAGCKMVLLGTAGNDLIFEKLLSKTEHIPLSNHPLFEQTYVEELKFPAF